MGFTVFIFREGFQEKLLSINLALEQNDNNLENLTLNTTFIFLTMIDTEGTEKANYFTNN
jgi:hypothetical protein